MYATTCMPVPLGEIYVHMLPCTPVISLETSVHVLTKFYLHVASMQELTQYSVHMLPRVSLLVLPRVCVSMYRLLQASAHLPLQESMIVVAVPRVCLFFFLAVWSVSGHVFVLLLIRSVKKLSFLFVIPVKYNDDCASDWLVLLTWTHARYLLYYYLIPKDK